MVDCRVGDAELNRDHVKEGGLGQEDRQPTIVGSNAELEPVGARRDTLSD
jgi:hypothetical protein